MKQHTSKERFYVTALIVRPGDTQATRQGLFVAADSERNARRSFRPTLARVTGWRVTRTMILRIVRVVRVRVLTGKNAHDLVR